MKTTTFRMIIDIAMSILLVLLMAYSLIGELFHEIAGTAIFVLFIIHQILNRKWYGGLFKGRYTPSRIFRTIIDLLLVLFMILQPLSGVLLSKHLYTFLPSLSISAFARSVHMLLAYWGYVLLSIHAGTHLRTPLQRLYQKDQKKSRVFFTVLLCISLYGMVAFIRRGFLGYMSGRTAFAFFDYAELKIFFFLDYLTIMILFMLAGCLTIYCLDKKPAVKQ